MLLATHDIGAEAHAQIGGKARGLLHIARAELPTPPWRVLPFASVARRAWHDDAAFRDQLHALFEAFGRHIAVRSSAEIEDGASSSHAGQFQTVFAASFEALLHALDTVADSAANVPMAIVLQQGLAPELAGVAFSADPAQARDDAFYVEAVRGHGSGLVEGAATPLRCSLSLTGELLTAHEALLAPHAALLARALATLEDALGAAVDLEWAVAHGALYVLQARPLTALAADAALVPTGCHTSWFFDQRFLEPISPFTRTTLVPLVLQASVGEALAMRGNVAAEARAVFHGGQAYVAHAAWRKALGGSPRWFLSPDLRQLYPAGCGCSGEVAEASTLRYAWDAARSVLRHRGEVFWNVGRWRAFRDSLPARIATALAMGAELRPAERFLAQWNALDALSRTFLGLHRWSILWADYAYRAVSLCAPLIGRKRAQTWLRVGGTLPTAAANAALARGDWARVCGEFGDRSESLDYAAPTWRERYGANASEAPREAATVRTDPPLRGVGALVRRLMEMREEQRFYWEQILAAQRRLVLSLPVVGQLAHAEEVWLLSFEELVAAGEGKALPHASALAARRHALRVERLVAKPLFLGGDKREAPRGDSKEFFGAGASAGVARGRLVHLPDPARGLPAGLARPRVLVVRALDPAHTYLLREVDGVIAERGGLLSHAAILAREYGVPLVTALEGALALLPAGATVEIDGQRGRVTLL